MSILPIKLKIGQSINLNFFECCSKLLNKYVNKITQTKIENFGLSKYNIL